MVLQFQNSGHERLYDNVLGQLDRIGYKGDLLQREYQFEDWFATQDGVKSQLTSLDAAAFGRLPLADDNACFAIEVTGDTKNAPRALLGRCRSLCAPFALQVAPSGVIVWPVRVDPASIILPPAIPPNRIQEYFDDREDDWNPASLLRAKNIGSPSLREFDSIDAGLLPAYEEHIRERLGPLIHDTLSIAFDTYRRRHPNVAQPGFRKLLRLVFRVLAGKVLTDRGHPGFQKFARNPDPDNLLEAVNHHFSDPAPLIGDPATTHIVVHNIWGAFSLKHLSAAILSTIWENTLVDDKIREELGLYGTPPAVAKFVIDRIGLDGPPEHERFVVEPCCGSGVFLLAAMRRLTELLDPDQYSVEQRHIYLREMLSGFDSDSFGVEVAKECLMLADYPNKNGWVIKEEDVFCKPSPLSIYQAKLSEARFVVCNPPFNPDFTDAQQVRYGTKSSYKPVELVDRVLRTCLSLRGVGFVLPHRVVSGIHYEKIRSQLAKRFGSIEIVSLPLTGVFSNVRYESVVLVATDPHERGHDISVTQRTLTEQDWGAFAASRSLPAARHAEMSVDEATESIAVPDLQDIWNYLKQYPKIASVLDKSIARKRGLARGLQWTKSLVHERHLIVSDTAKKGYLPGIISAEGEGLAYVTPCA